MKTREILAVLLAISLAVVAATPQTHGQNAPSSGSFSVVVPGSRGTSSYTVDWSYPSSVTVGQKFNVSATLFVDGLTGLKLFVDTYFLTSLMELPGKAFVASGNVSSAYGCDRPQGCGSPHIYPGEHWGPENISLTVTNPSNVIPSGNSIATVSFGFVTTVWYDAPASQDYQEAGSQIAGNITLVNSGNPSTSGSIVPFFGFVAFGGAMGPLVLYAFSRLTRKSGSPEM